MCVVNYGLNWCDVDHGASKTGGKSRVEPGDAKDCQSVCHAACNAPCHQEGWAA